jgi:hypothetical protein
MAEAGGILNFCAVFLPGIIRWKKGVNRLYSQGDFLFWASLFSPFFVSFFYSPNLWIRPKCGVFLVLV